MTPGSQAPASRLAAWSPCHPGADDLFHVVPEARKRAERAPSVSGLLATALSVTARRFP
jgi:hypothetical protein